MQSTVSLPVSLDVSLLVCQSFSRSLFDSLLSPPAFSLMLCAVIACMVMLTMQMLMMC